MNGPEGFLPKKLNFTMQVVQVLWYRPIIDTAVTPPGARERRLGRTFDSVWSVAWRGLYRVVFQKVPSEANPKVRNHGEGPY